ncbi:hypothetical protein [Massilia glaciei]|uniref:Uncharacterized protein n=1 Tax=Massilia glaciei TaxID=1524097 RepID=A0A2U2HLV6_9BURK|nr:hypothetical protein [Massilia glaciei]PWF48487.1 hypothetical protein C7C56_011670 [Massilia glaciei]
MTAEPDLLERKRRSDRAAIVWIVVGAAAAVLAFAGFLVWQTGVARDAWFERERLFEDHGVWVDAIAVGKQCSMRSVTYKWNWQGKDYSGVGFACDTTCDAMAMGTAVSLRVVPARPALV